MEEPEKEAAVFIYYISAGTKECDFPLVEQVILEIIIFRPGSDEPQARLSVAARFWCSQWTGFLCRCCRAMRAFHSPNQLAEDDKVVYMNLKIREQPI